MIDDHVNTDEDVMREAMFLASSGIRTIPLYKISDGICNCHKGAACESPGKHPVWTNFFDKATKDHGEIVELYTEDDRNLGIPTGEVNGIFVLDFDGAEGLSTLAAWKDAGLPETWEVETGSGGRHLYYSIPFGTHFEIRNTVKSLGPGVDVRGEHGYVVAPGSIHASGNTYRWFTDVEEVDIVQPPQWLIDKILNSMRKSKTKVTTDHIELEINWDYKPDEAFTKKISAYRIRNEAFEGILTGKIAFTSASERDWAMFKEMARGGFTAQEIANFAIFMRYLSGDKMKHDGYYAESISKAIAEVAREKAIDEQIQAFTETAAAALIEELKIDPPEVPKVGAFPVDVFPHAVREFVTAVSVSTGAPIDFVATNVLAACGSAIGKSRKIKIWEKFETFPTLYCAVIGEPGTAKTPAMKLAFEPIWKRQHQYAKEHATLKIEHDAAMEEYRERMDVWKKSKPMKGYIAPTMPVLEPEKRLVSTDATTERLAQMLGENPRGILLQMDELSALIRGMNQYKGGKGSDRSFYLSAWSNTDIRIDRKKEAESISVEDPVLSIVGNLPPGVFRNIEAKENEEDGFLDRFLIVYPDVQGMKPLSFIGVDAHHSANYARVVNELLSLSIRSEAVTLSMEATLALAEWDEKHVAQVNVPEISDRVKSIFSKMRMQLARIALILHCTDSPHGKEIRVETMRAAIEVIEYFKRQAMKLYHTVDISEEEARVNKALKWIRERGGTVSSKDFQMNRVAGCTKKEDVVEMFSTLESYGYGRLVEQVQKNGKIRKEFQLF